MELKVPSPRPGDSPPDDLNDPEEKEVSEDDDDDRNHKHRRREAGSQSSETDALDPSFSRPYRKRSKPYGNGNPFKEGDFQLSNSNKRRPGMSSFSRAPLDSTQKFRVSHPVAGDTGPGRGRGREPGFWGPSDPRFSSGEVASQLVQRGSMPASLFAGRGVPSTSQNTSWRTFGMVPALPNGVFDTLHPPLALQGTLRQPITPGLNIGIPRQRCRDFEERGFCLRGDMCPMEHGVNRIVVEDVQSLSQFNLPVSLPSAHLLGPPTGKGLLAAVSAPSTTLTSSKALGSKVSKHGMNDDSMEMNHVSVAAGADVYDPDQPLWANDDPETSAALLSLNPTTMAETESSFVMEPSDRLHFGFPDHYDNERPVKNSMVAAPQSQGSSVWGRIRSSKNRSDVKEKIDSTLSSTTYPINEARENVESLTSVHGASLTSVHGAAHQGKRLNTEKIGEQVTESPPRTKVDSGRNIRKPSQKALRTLFVNGIPKKDNRREALLSHFQKFGEVIDIYIPVNSERAFVQFSRREEAESALKSPDAVMGNRFIKLFWANRDSISDDGISGGSNVRVTASGMALASVALQLSVSAKVKDNHYSSASKSNIAHFPTIPASDLPQQVVGNGLKAPSVQKKMETLELLKEEIRKKQEMLDQKRNQFRQQLDKLEKQATGIKDEQASDPGTKSIKVGIVGDSAKSEASKSSGSVAMPPQAEGVSDSGRHMDNIMRQGPKLSSTGATPEFTAFKPSIRPLAPFGAPFVMNRFKLDNRPTAFKITPPLPSGLANVTALKEHFSSYGDLTVELERLEPEDDSNNESDKSVAARICFTTRRAAEKAFLDGKCWQGHNLQFIWLNSINSGKDTTNHKDDTAASSKQSSDTDFQSAPEAASTVSPKEANLAIDVSGDDLDKRESDPDNSDAGNIVSSSVSISSDKLSP